MLDPNFYFVGRLRSLCREDAQIADAWTGGWLRPGDFQRVAPFLPPGLIYRHWLADGSENAYFLTSPGPSGITTHTPIPPPWPEQIVSNCLEDNDP